METESAGDGSITQNAKALLFLTISLFLGVIFSGCATKPPPQRVAQINADVYYGGVYLVAGSIDDIKPRFPELSTTMASPAGEKLKGDIRDRFKVEKEDFSKINLTGFSGELAGNDSVVMACGFTGEKYFSESGILGDKEIRNVTAYLGGSLLLQSFKKQGDGGQYDIKLLACYPFSMICIGLAEDNESPEMAGGRLIAGDQIGLGSDSFTKIVKGLAGKVAPVTGLGATMQVRNIAVAEKAERFVGAKFGGSNKEFQQWLAGELGAQLARQIGLSIIPYAEDTSSQKLAVMMENGSAYNIALPQPDFILDIEILGFSKALAKETASESLWVYGAYATVSIKEAGTGAVRWQKEIKAGVPKKIAATQTVIDHSGAEFSALLALLEVAPADLLADPKARPLLNSCLK
jgi:hypothetical protein